MPKSRSPTRKSSGNSHAGKKKRGKSRSKSRDASPIVPPREVTIFDPAALDNLYYIAHSAPDALSIRGFGYKGEKKKKKGRKGKKKK
jgi:hypothetical protein